MRESRKFCQRGSNFDNVFFKSWWGEGGSKSLFKQAIIGPPAKRRFSGMPMNAQHWMLASQLRFLRGSGPVLLENPIFCDFSWGGPDPLSPLWIRTCNFMIVWYLHRATKTQTSLRKCAFSIQHWWIRYVKHHRFYVEWINFVSHDSNHTLEKRPFCI